LGTPGGELQFVYATQASGVGAIGQLFVGWGTGFLDLTNRGLLDLVITNGHVIRHPRRAKLRQGPVLFANEGHGRFVEVTRRGGSYFQGRHQGRGLAVGDLDNDGQPDLVISHLNEPVVILRNVAAVGNHWLGVELAGTTGPGNSRKAHGDVVGAKVQLEVNGRLLTRFAKGGGSYLSSGDRRLLFGLKKAQQVKRLTVFWPSGRPRKQTWRRLPVDSYHRLVQGIARPLPPKSKRTREKRPR
jgi:hypothetical protein